MGLRSESRFRRWDGRRSVIREYFTRVGKQILWLANRPTHSEQLQIGDQHDAETDDEVTDEGTHRFR